MNKDGIDKLTEVIKKGALKFHDDFDKNLNYSFFEEEKENEIIVHFTIKYDRDVKYLIKLKKQNIDTDYIPDVKGYNKLSSNSNPYKSLKFSDRNEILGNIYDYLKEIDIAEIVCYEKFGIIIRNPACLTGIYNIDVQYV